MERRDAGDRMATQMRSLLSCPICMQIISDPFVTPCGHSFCYACLRRHLADRSTCPSCSQQVSAESISPNFMLQEIVRRTSDTDLASTADPLHRITRTLTQCAADLTLADITLLIDHLASRRDVLERQGSAATLQLLLRFLQHCHASRSEKRHDAARLLEKIKEDEEAAETQLQHVIVLQERQRMQEEEMQRLWKQMRGGHEPREEEGRGAPLESSSDRLVNVIRERIDRLFASIYREYLLLRMGRMPTVEEMERLYTKSDGDGSLAALTAAAMAVSSTTMLDATAQQQQHSLDDFSRFVNQLVRYGSLQCLAQAGDVETRDDEARRDESEEAGGGAATTTTRTQPSTMAQSTRSSGIISSVDFSPDGMHFATASVSKHVSIYSYPPISSSSATHPATSPLSLVAEYTASGKLSCVSWSKLYSQFVAASDYQGHVSIWDVQAGRMVHEHMAHEKRIWSLDYSRTDAMQYATASDDGTICLWNMGTNGNGNGGGGGGASHAHLHPPTFPPPSSTPPAPLLRIAIGANVCSVQYHPTQGHLLAVGSLDHKIHIIDIRRPNQVVLTLQGHERAVSYVKWYSSSQVASASTDGTLRLWDVTRPPSYNASSLTSPSPSIFAPPPSTSTSLTFMSHPPVRFYRGHVNARSFIGLSVTDGYIACGSETNEVCVYNEGADQPIARYALHPSAASLPHGSEDGEARGTPFVSALCWRPNSKSLVATNSQGRVRVLRLE